jgi:hypothetical protein
VAASAPETGHLAGSPVSFLPGPVPDRETWEGWTRWRLTRRDFVPAPVVSAAEHAGMTARQRRLHDLRRVATRGDGNRRKRCTSCVYIGLEFHGIAC